MATLRRVCMLPSPNIVPFSGALAQGAALLPLNSSPPSQPQPETGSTAGQADCFGGEVLKSELAA